MYLTGTVYKNVKNEQKRRHFFKISSFVIPQKKVSHTLDIYIRYISIYLCSPYFINSFRKGRSGDCFETCTTFHSCFVIPQCFFSQSFHDVEHVSHSPLCFAPDSSVIPHISLSPYAFDDTGQHSREKKLACASVLVFYKAAIYISKYKHGAHEFLQWKH